ncbi:hypothetical protein [Pseudoxanthomonas suwonensis]|uniref:hypothetical protein n=1 Tax=Pseudoxanthomonas suwonensis TaxID=314722 RepID=UPI00048F33DB|nr:hypothetical protein [Pseudoxanthomonas suwonensis]
MKDLRLQVVLSAIDQATGPLKRVLSGSKGLSAALKEQHDLRRKLEAQQRDIAGFRVQSQALRQSAAAYEAQQAKCAPWRSSCVRPRRPPRH